MRVACPFARAVHEVAEELPIVGSRQLVILNIAVAVFDVTQAVNPIRAVNLNARAFFVQREGIIVAADESCIF